MNKCFAGGHLRYVDGAWRDDNGDVVDIEPVRHGEWDALGRYTFPDGSLAVRCSECGCDLEEHEYKEYWWHYCPVCGAKMDGKEKE